jgi:hypothetical protein
MRSRFAASVARTVARRIRSCALDLGGWTVATECANSAYAATAAAALAAGAEVWALGRDTRWATVAESAVDVRALATALRDLGLDADEARLHLVTDRAAIPYEGVDLISNSGHLRPLDAEILGRLPAHAVIALMFEAWELRDGDIDVATARARCLPIYGVDEHHPVCGSFEFVGALAVSEAMRQRWSLGDARVAVISDNVFLGPVLRAVGAMGAAAVAIDPFGRVPPAAEFAEHGYALADAILAGATVARAAVAADGGSTTGAFDLAILATTPPAVARANGLPRLDERELGVLIAATGCHGCVQLWGDVRREGAEAQGVVFAPARAPAPGHQAVPMNAAGHEAVVRLQVGGLAAALHGRRLRDGEEVSDALSGLVQEVAPR